MQVLYFFESIRNPVLDFIMSVITYLGHEALFMVFVVFFFWCVNKNTGYYLITVGLLGTSINQFMKNMFRIPRPWVLDPNFTIVENARAAATGYSFPSGHTQSAVGLFGGMAVATKKKQVRIITIIAAILVPISRMYLGVHTPLDTGIATITAVALIFALYPIFKNSDKKSMLVPMTFLIISIITAALFAAVILYKYPADVDINNITAGQMNMAKVFGASIGLLIGWFIEKKYVQFDTQAAWYVQVIKVIGGLAITLAIKTFLKAPLIAVMGETAGGAVRYGIIVIFAVAIWPLIFKPLNRVFNRDANEEEQDETLHEV